MSTPDVFASEVFGAPVIRVEPEEIDDHDAWRQEGVWLAWLRMEHLWESSSDKWRHIETLETYRGWLEQSDEDLSNCRYAKGADAVSCALIAARAFIQDRWHQDSRIPNAGANMLKALTAVQFVTEMPLKMQTCLGIDDTLAGFLAYQRDGYELVINLIAIAAEYRGNGFGEGLIKSIMNAHWDAAKSIRASTQSHNTAAKAFYESLGFVKVSEQHTYHWINEEAAP